MAPEKRTYLIQWLSFGLTALIIIVCVVLAFGEVRSKQSQLENSDRAQWQKIREGESRGDVILRRLDVIQFNQRRDMEDRGVRYIDTER